MPFSFHVDASVPPPASAIVARALAACGGTPAAADRCDLLWTSAPAISQLRRIGDPVRRISRLLGSEALTTKARLASAIGNARARASRLGPDAPLPSYPRTFSMPDEVEGLRIAAAYAPGTRWLRRPKAPGTNQRPTLLADVANAGVDPRWIVQEYLGGSGAATATPIVRIPALIACIDPLIVDVWDDEAAPVDAALRAATDTTIAAVAAFARDAMAAEVAALEVPMAGGFELLVFDFLRDADGGGVLVDCEPWPGVKPPPDLRPQPTAQAAESLVRSMLGRLDLAPTRSSAGGWRRVMPSADPARLTLLRAPLPSDIAAARHAATGAGDEGGGFRPQGVHHMVLDDALVLFSEESETLSILNATGSYLWLRTAEGAAPSDVAREAAELFRGDAERVAQDVWAALASWIADGLVARRDPPPSAPATRVASTGERPRHGWNAGERVYEYLGRRLCVRAPAGDIDRWLHTTLEPYDQPEAATYHDTLELLPRGSGFELLVNGGRTLGPLAPRDIPAAVHAQIRRLALEAHGCLLSTRATVAHTIAGAWILLDAHADRYGALLGALKDGGADVRLRQRLVWRGAPVRVAAAARIDTPLPICGLVAVQAAVEGEHTSLASTRRADVFRQLLGDDPDAVTVLDAAGAARLVDFISHAACLRLIVADAAAAASLIVHATIDNGSVVVR